MYNLGGAFAGVLIFLIIISVVFVFLSFWLSKFKRLYFFEKIGKISAIILGFFIVAISLYIWIERSYL